MWSVSYPGPFQKVLKPISRNSKKHNVKVLTPVCCSITFLRTSTDDKLPVLHNTQCVIRQDTMHAILYQATYTVDA